MAGRDRRLDLVRAQPAHGRRPLDEGQRLLDLTGEAWSVEEAQRYGLVQAVTPPGQQLERALEFARKIATAAPLGVRATIAAVHRYEQDGEAAAFPTLRPELARLMTTQDFGEAVRALTDQRAPVYHGR